MPDREERVRRPVRRVRREDRRRDRSAVGGRVAREPLVDRLRQGAPARCLLAGDVDTGCRSAPGRPAPIWMAHVPPCENPPMVHAAAPVSRGGVDVIHAGTSPLR